MLILYNNIDIWTQISPFGGRPTFSFFFANDEYLSTGVKQALKTSSAYAMSYYWNTEPLMLLLRGILKILLLHASPDRLAWRPSET